jgi:tRNA dimethylallyltransferase
MEIRAKKGLLVIIAGPTAVGKTDVSIELAISFGTEVISADSRQMYREMQIGTARPTEEQMQEVKHHFVANISINDYYNASMYEFECISLLEELFQKHEIVVLTGGSGLYIDAITKGIDDLPTIDPEVRSNMLSLYENEGIEGLRNRLKIIDPEYYSKADLMNHKRLLKALEVATMTGMPYSTFLTYQKKERTFDMLKICLNTDRELLYKRINQRVDNMLEQGLLDEVKSLLPYRKLNALNTVGYKEFFDYFDNKITLETAIELIKRDTRRYAKRQITWFSRDKNEYNWIDVDEKEKIVKLIEEYKTKNG